LSSLLLLAATLVGCGMGKRNYEEAVSNPVREFPLEVRLAKVEKLGSDYRYAFQVTNTGQQAFEGPVDFDLINQALTVYTTSTRMGFAVGPGQTVLVNIDTPSEPHSVDPDGYRHWVFRAYSHQEHLLVRTHGDVPALSQ
jgi:hypothetical protein